MLAGLFGSLFFFFWFYFPGFYLQLVILFNLCPFHHFASLLLGELALAPAVLHIFQQFNLLSAEVCLAAVLPGLLLVRYRACGTAADLPPVVV